MNALEKLKSITSGWKNVVFLSPTVEKLALERAKICAACPYAVEDTWLEAVGKLLKNVTNYKCNRCNCPISAKTRSIQEECPHPDGPKW